MKLKLTTRAIEDIFEISRYLKQKNPSVSLKIRHLLFEAMHRLTLFPMSGSEQISGVRRLITYKYRYLIYYRVDSEAKHIEIITIQHSSRDREFEHV
ncbi:MAG: type II toxin-antitoxin system RelE/ParE family toxin [Alphaproteobacteria bacterium]|nr:type II toxin-antitoxin system RelE/ParE family toxin [Alphaproteobacteria bacterium]